MRSFEGDTIEEGIMSASCYPGAIPLRAAAVSW
jgi:hypothetical protein